MPSSWFCKNGENEVGPLSSNQLRLLAKAGRITPNTPIRKDDSDWVAASRIKGLFDGSGMPDESKSEPDSAEPLIIPASEVTSSELPASESSPSTKSPPNSMVSAVGGKVSAWFGRREEKKTEAAKVSERVDLPSNEGQTGWLSALTRDNQNPKIVKKISEKIVAFLIAGEVLKYIAIQSEPIVNWLPDCIVLTNKRFIFFRTKVLGQFDFEDYAWKDLGDAAVSENVIGSTITIKTAAGRTIAMDHLPKAQARAVYRISNEIIERFVEVRRIEEEAVASDDELIQTNSTPPTSQPAAAEDHDPVEKLQKLRKMLDFGLITTAEYVAKKAEILARM